MSSARKRKQWLRAAALTGCYCRRLLLPLVADGPPQGDADSLRKPPQFRYVGREHAMLVPLHQLGLLRHDVEPAAVHHQRQALRPACTWACGKHAADGSSICCSLRTQQQPVAPCTGCRVPDPVLLAPMPCRRSGATCTQAPEAAKWHSQPLPCRLPLVPSPWCIGLLVPADLLPAVLYQAAAAAASAALVLSQPHCCACCFHRR